MAVLQIDSDNYREKSHFILRFFTSASYSSEWRVTKNHYPSWIFSTKFWKSDLSMIVILLIWFIFLQLLPFHLSPFVTSYLVHFTWFLPTLEPLNLKTSQPFTSYFSPSQSFNFPILKSFNSQTKPQFPLPEAPC